MVMGEITTTAYVDIPLIVRRTIRDIGYTGEAGGFDADACAVITTIDEQSPDISMGVDRALESRLDGCDSQSTGAGDQGMVFGFANSDTPELMPLPIALAHRLTRRLTAARKEGLTDILRPDGKSQVTISYENEKPVHVDTIVVSTQHCPDATPDDVENVVRELVIKPTIPADLISEKTRILINPTGRFVVGGPQGDSGLTGRKIICDTYGGFARHGGGAFSGKDPTKVDRSASYAARHIAKNIVAAGLATTCEVQIAYAIGVAEPVSVMVGTFGTGVLPDDQMTELVLGCFDLRPDSIIQTFDLRRPIYEQTSNYGHFGRVDVDLPWEQTDKVVALKQAFEQRRHHD